MGLKEALWLFPPRCTILVSTVDSQGRKNLAPYSEFIKTYNDEFVIAMANERHSLKNIRETNEFVAALPTISLAEKISMTGKPFPEGVSEFEKAGLTPLKAEKVRPALVKECIANFECRLLKEFTLNENAVLVVGSILAAHYDEKSVKGELEARTSSNAALYVGRGNASSIYTTMNGKPVDTGIDFTKV